MRTHLPLYALALLTACPPAAAPRCEADAGETDFEVQFRFINLGRETVTVQLEGEDAGQQVLAFGSVAKVGHGAVALQRGTVEARNFLADGGREAVTLPFEFDASADEPATFVLKDLGPSRLSTNMTIERQTPKRDFGERAMASLGGVEIEGGVDLNGDCLTDAAGPLGVPARVGLHAEPQSQDCPGTADDLYVRSGAVDADATPYFVRGRDGELQVAWITNTAAIRLKAGAPLSQGASLLGGALPGGAVISARTQPLYVLNADASAQPLTVSLEDVEVATAVAPGALVRVKSNLIARAARKAIAPNGTHHTVLARVAIAGGATRTVELGAGDLGPCKPPWVCDFLLDEPTLLVASENPSSSATVLKARHEVAKNIIGNIRRPIVLATTSLLETRGCVAVFPTDDTCVMGAAVVTSVSGVSSGGGGASSAAYAATGRMLYPPKTAPQGVPLVVAAVENGAIAQRFTWDDPAGLTPTTGQAPAGFAIVASGLVLDASAAARRALLFVNTDASPWTVQSSLSK